VRFVPSPISTEPPRHAERRGGGAAPAVSISPWAFLLGATVLIGALAIPGALTVRRGGGGAFDLDGELTVPALASAGLLLCAAYAAALAMRWDPVHSRRPWAALALLFAVMGVDEATGMHEALEDASAIDWQTLYVPVVLIAGLAWLVALLRLRGRFERAAWLAAAGAWFAAQVLEALEWTGPRETERAVDGYGIMMGFEELLEMAGSALFAVALLAAVRRWTARAA
jgi:hypothetical protein